MRPVLAAALALAVMAAPAMAQQQRRPRVLTGNPIADIKNATGGGAPAAQSAITGDPIADLHNAIKKGGAKLILHLKQSYALASAPVGDAGSPPIDGISAPCSKALVPIFDLVINGPKAAAIVAPDPMALTDDEVKAAADTSQTDGPLVIIEKLRILRISFSSSALTIACGPLVQDEVKNAQNIAGKITSLITGAALLPAGL